MAQVTSPIILDSTGQQIHSDLQQIKNVLTTPSTAEDISFDNTGTGMQADDVQDAITELKSNLTDLTDALTWAHETLSVTATNDEVNFTTTSIPAIITCKQIIVITDATTQNHFFNTGGSCTAFNTCRFNSQNVDGTYREDIHIQVDFTNGTVGIREPVKGTLRNYRKITDVYYI